MKNGTLPEQFGEFRNQALLSMEDICREIYLENRESISVKKERLAVKNLALIFDATLKLSAEKGFQAMSLRDLCRESGLSMGALYSYISGKEKLLEIILQQGRRIVKKILDGAVSEKKDPRDRLHSAVRTHVYLSEVLQRWFFFAFMETKNLNREEQRSAMASELYTEKIFTDILEEGAGAGIFTVRDAPMTAAMIKALLQDWYLKRWKYTKRGVTVEDYARYIISAIDSIIL